MQVTETLSQGLKREFQVVLPPTELEERLSSELDDPQGQGAASTASGPARCRSPICAGSTAAPSWPTWCRTPSTRPNRKIVDDNGLKLAHEPQIQFPEDKEEIEQALEAKADLAFTVALEVLPSFELADLSDVAVTKPVAEVSGRRRRRGARAHGDAEPRLRGQAEGEAAASGDRVTIDFIGTIDGEPFEGGTGEGIQVELGSGQFIPGFEEQLVGAKAGEERKVKRPLPGELPGARISPARRPSSTSPSRRSRRRARSRSTTSSPRASAWRPSTRCKRRGARRDRARLRRAVAAQAQEGAPRRARRASTPSSCRRPWSSRSSRPCGRRSRRT